SRGETRPVAVVFAQENPDLEDQLPHFPLPAQIWGNSPTNGYKFMLNSGVDVTDNVELYLFGNLAHSEADQSFNFRSSLLGTRPFTAFDGTNNITINLGGRSFFQHPYYQTLCPTGNPTCPAGGYVLDGNTFFLSSIYPAGFTPRFVGVTDQIFGATGLKGSSGDFRYDLSTSLARNKLPLSMCNSISPSYGGASQTSFEFGDLIQKEWNVNLDVAYELQAGLASPITLSGGAETRKETYKTTAGDVQSYGAGPYASPHPLFVQTSPGVYAPTGQFTAVEDPAASGFGGTSPTYAGSNSEFSYGFYAGAEADITEQLTMGAAARYDHDESFGGTTVFKLNGKYDFSDAFSIRGTVGTGFHAPSPGQNNVQNLTTNFVSGVSLQQGTFPVTSAVAQYCGAQPPKPAEATNYGLGTVITPAPNVTLTVDAYSIKVRDRIFISRPFRVTAADIVALPELASVGVNGVVQYFTNSFDTRTRGLDVVGTWR